MAPTHRGNLTAHESSPDNQEYRQFALPLPAPDRVAWEKNLAAALAMDPRRKDNYERYLQAQRGVDVDYIPVRLDIENVSRCNFRCSMCQVSGWGPKYQRAGDMTLDQFRNLIDEQYGLVEIKLHGMGEPLLGGEVFLDMVRYARSKGIWVRTSTNGSLLHFKDNYRKLVDAGINEVQISFDGATKGTFEGIRQGSKFELEVRNCKLINDYCNKAGLLVTRMWVLLQRANTHEFHDFVEIAAQMGFRRLTYSLNLHGWGQEKWLAENEGKAAEGSVSLEMARAAVDRGRQLGLEATFWNITSKYSTDKVENLCPWPFQWAYVSSDMRIVPCPMIANPDVVELGDARQFTKEWNGANYKEFRLAHLQGRIPVHCKICYMNGPISRKAASQ